MRIRGMLTFRPTLASLALLSLFTPAAYGLNIAYCSNQNTAPDETELNNIYNSNGACQTHCQANYAFAIVQYQSCWCSDYIPGDTTGVSDCNQECPGFPSDKCGNAGLGLFGYIALSQPPSGTLGAPIPSPSSVQVPAPSDPSPQTTSYVSTTVSIIVPITPSPDTSVQVSYVTQVPSPHISVSTEVSSATVTPSPITSIRVVIISGAPVTQTVTSTPIVEPNSSAETITVSQKTGLSGGAVAGIVLGVLFGVAAVVLAAFLLWRRRRRASEEQTTDATVGNEQRSNPRRNVSVLSKTGLLARARPSMSERERDHDDQYWIPPLTGHNSNRQSMLLGLSGDAMETSSPLGGSQDGEGRRSSKPFIYDQRLNPSALYAGQDNGSRVSMQDNNDYSRPLGVANPDTRPSFESQASHG